AQTAPSAPSNPMQSPSPQSRSYPHHFAPPHLQQQYHQQTMMAQAQVQPQTQIQTQNQPSTITIAPPSHGYNQSNNQPITPARQKLLENINTYIPADAKYLDTGGDLTQQANNQSPTQMQHQHQHQSQPQTSPPGQIPATQMQHNPYYYPQ